MKIMNKQTDMLEKKKIGNYKAEMKIRAEY